MTVVIIRFQLVVTVQTSLLRIPEEYASCPLLRRRNPNHYWAGLLLSHCALWQSAAYDVPGLLNRVPHRHISANPGWTDRSDLFDSKPNCGDGGTTVWLVIASSLAAFFFACLYHLRLALSLAMVDGDFFFFLFFLGLLSQVGWLCWCFTALRHTLGHFRHGQLT